SARREEDRGEITAAAVDLHDHRRVDRRLVRRLPERGVDFESVYRLDRQEPQRSARQGVHVAGEAGGGGSDLVLDARCDLRHAHRNLPLACPFTKLVFEKRSRTARSHTRANFSLHPQYSRMCRSYVPRRAIRCSELAQQRHKIIQKGVALALSVADRDRRADHRGTLVGPAVLWPDQAGACILVAEAPMNKPGAATRRNGTSAAIHHTINSANAPT